MKKSKENVIWQRNCRVIATVMLLIAIAFIGYALTHPEAGSVFYIGNFEVGVAEMIAFYKFYAAIMISRCFVPAGASWQRQRLPARR